MKNLTALIQSAQQGELAAYDCIVRQFQDMAVGYCYSLLHDFHWAEDAAQEALLQAFLDLPTLHDPLAFPAWLRKILFKQCDRLARRNRVLTCPLETGWEAPCPLPGPAQAAEEAETRHALKALIDRLPAKEREVIALFYIGGHSQEEMSHFLEVPVTTVKKRLQAARQRLKEKMLIMVQDDFQQQAPSRDTRFADEIAAALREFHAPNPVHDSSLMPWVKLYRAFDAAAEAARPVASVERAVFNALLQHTQQLLPDDPVLQAIPEAGPNDTAAELRVSAGLANYATCRNPVLDFKAVLRESHSFRNNLEKSVQVQPGQPAPASAVTIFNVFLRTVKRRWPTDAVLQATPEAALGLSIEALAVAAAGLAQVLEDAMQAMTEAERDQAW